MFLYTYLHSIHITCDIDNNQQQTYACQNN